MKNMKTLKSFKMGFVLLLAVVMVSALSSCGNGDSVAGRWSASTKVNFNSEELDIEQFPFLENTVCNYNLVLDEDGTYTLSQSVPKEQKDSAVEGYKKLYINYYKMKNDEADIEALMEEASCDTIEELTDQLLLGAAQAEGYSSAADFICARLNLNTRVLGNGEYELDGKKILMYSSSNPDTVTYTAFYDGDTIVVTYDGGEIEFTLQK